MNSVKDYLIAVVLALATAVAAVRAVAVFQPQWLHASGADAAPEMAGTMMIAVIDMDAIANEAARLQARGSSSRLDWYQQAVQEVSQEMAKKGYYVLPRAIFLVTPSSGVNDLTPAVKQRLREIAQGASGSPAASMGVEGGGRPLTVVPQPIYPKIGGQ